MTFQRLSLSLVNNRKPLTAVFLPLVRFSAHVFLLACLRAAKLAGSKSVAKKFPFPDNLSLSVAQTGKQSQGSNGDDKPCFLWHS